MDKEIVSETFGMTLEEMEREITVFRALDAYMQECVPGYDMILKQFSLYYTGEWLRSIGLNPDKFMEAMDTDKTDLM